MSQPVKLSDALVLDARMVGEAQERSIAGQVEFWAKLGRSVETLLDGRQVLALCRTANAVSLSAALDAVEQPSGRRLLQNHLETIPYPHYEAHPTRTGLLIRREEDGTETVGKFVNREFVMEGRILPRRAAREASRATRSRKSRRTRA
jgi:hypothetical protein